jgi:hypothetical protein
MDEKFVRTLGIISEKLASEGVDWAVAGSFGLFLLGVDVKPNDIDIIVSTDKIFRVGEILKEYEVFAVRYKSSDFLESNIGAFDIDGVEVEVMDDLKIKKTGRVLSLKVDELENVKVGNFFVGVYPLEKQLEFYGNSDREKDVDKVRKIRQAILDFRIRKV